MILYNKSIVGKTKPYIRLLNVNALGLKSNIARLSESNKIFLKSLNFVIKNNE